MALFASAKLIVRQNSLRQRFVHREAFVGKWINLWAVQVKQKPLFALANVERSSQMQGVVADTANGLRLMRTCNRCCFNRLPIANGQTGTRRKIR